MVYPFIQIYTYIYMGDIMVYPWFTQVSYPLIYNYIYIMVKRIKTSFQCWQFGLSQWNSSIIPVAAWPRMFTGSIPHIPTTFSRSKHWLKHQLPWFNRRFLKHVKAPSSLMKPPYLLLKFPRPEAAPTRRPLDQELTRLADKATSEMAWNRAMASCQRPSFLMQWPSG